MQLNTQPDENSISSNDISNIYSAKKKNGSENKSATFINSEKQIDILPTNLAKSTLELHNETQNLLAIMTHSITERRNIRQEENVNLHTNRRNDLNVSNIKKPSIFFEPPFELPIFQVPTKAFVSSPDDDIQSHATTDTNISSDLDITVKSNDLNVPSTNNEEYSEKMFIPDKKILTPQLKTIKDAERKSNTRNIDVNFESLSLLKILNNKFQPSIINITIPSNDLLPPLEEIKLYDSTTQGPLIYYEWKEAGPALELEPPKFESVFNLSETIYTTKTPRDVAKNVLQSFRSIPVTHSIFSTESTLQKTEDTISIPTEETDYSKLRQKLFIPDFQFPLESGFNYKDNNSTVDSFQTKINSK